MRPKRDPIPRAREALSWLVALLTLGLLGAGVAAAAMVLWENVDVRQLAPRLTPTPAPLPPPRLAADPTWSAEGLSAVILESPSSAAFFPDETFYPEALAGWRALASATGAALRSVTSAEELAGVRTEELLLIPEAPCVSEAEIDQIRRHLRDGGGVLANWAVAARDENCEWRGWGFLQEITGTVDIRETAVREALFIAVPGGIPLSAGMDPGARVELRGEPSLAAVTAETRVYLADWALNPAPDESGGGADAAAVTFRTPEGGRVAWIGPRLNQGATPQDSLKLGRLIRNGMLWAAGVPMAQAAPWPGGRRAALVAALEVESGAENASEVAQVLQAQGVPGTFFAVTGDVEGNVDLGGVLAAAGEVGTQTSDHTPLAGLTRQDQTLRLRRSRNDISRLVGIPADGLRPPEERIDARTMEVWRSLGGTYILSLNNGRSASPELHVTGDGLVVLIPRLMKDDYNVFVQDGALRAYRLTEAWLDGAQKIRSLGGVATLVGHTQILNGTGRLEAIGEVLDSLQAQGDWWMTTGREVASWWLERDQVRLTWMEPDTVSPGEGLAPSGLRDLLVELPLDAAGTSGLWVEVILPLGGTDLVPWVEGDPSGFATGEGGLQIPVGDLAPGDTRRIRLLRVQGEDPPGVS